MGFDKVIVLCDDKLDPQSIELQITEVHAMVREPMSLFEEWYALEQKLSTARIPSACCLSTHGIDGFPNARFLALKGISMGTFVVTGSQSSRKGVEIDQSKKVALTFWWPVTERQVRVQGVATQISDEKADVYFAERNRDSQIVSIVSRQGEDLVDLQSLVQAYEELDASHTGRPLTRPHDWGGYAIAPIRIEFLEFKESRFHDRWLYEMQNGKWDVRRLKP